MSTNSPKRSLLLLLPLFAAGAAGAQSSQAWQPMDGAPERMATWSMLALKGLSLDGTDGTDGTELYSVTHAGEALGWAWQDSAFTPLESTPWGEIKGDRHAVVPCDVDRDGDLDLVQAWGGAKGAGGAGARILVRQDQGWERVFIPGTSDLRMRGVQCVDLNGDGQVEIWLPSFGTADADQLVEVTAQDGVFSFVDRAPERGLDRAESSFGGLFGDVNGDGRQDLFRMQSNQVELLLQGPDGRFVPAPWQSEEKRIRDVALEDLDNDGDLDIVLARAGYFGDAAGDRGAKLQLKAGDVDNLVWSLPEGCDKARIEANGTLSGKAAKLTSPKGKIEKKMVVNINGPAWAQEPQGEGLLVWTLPEARLVHLSAMGVVGKTQIGIDCMSDPALSPSLVHADIDTRPPNEVSDLLYLNDGSGGFTQAPLPAGIAELETVDVLAVDVDLDGDLDLFLVTESAPAVLLNQPDQLLENLGNGQFVIASSWPASGQQQPIYGRSALAVDLNGDRHPELLVSNGEYMGPLSGTPALWENPGSSNNWVEVIALDADGYPSLSATIQVQTKTQTQTRSAHAFPDFRVHSQGQRALFGLGQASRAKVTVTWPDGSKRVMRRVAAGEPLVVSHPDAQR
ncbi:MAG: hypothetical protein ACI9VR_000175 [Cognaticolwellia sp.]